MRKFKIELSAILSVLTFYIGFYSVLSAIVKYIVIVLTAVCLLIGFDYNSCFKKHKKINSLMFVFCVITIFVSYINRNLTHDRDVFLAAIVFCAILLELLLTVEYIADHGKMNVMISVYFYLTLIVTVITDILALRGRSDLYLVGTKFSVVYLHFNLIAFYSLYNKTKRKKNISNIRKNDLNNLAIYAVFYLITAFIAVKVDCMTGVVGIVALAVFYILVQKFSKFFYNRITLFVAFALSFSFMWVHSTILNNQYIMNFITETLDTSATLTGRTEIYNAIPKVMQGYWLFGYGYGSAYEICMNKIGAADSQNGLMQMIMQIGIIGTAVMLMWMLYAIRSAKGNLAVKQYTVPMVSLIYLYIFLGTIEITYSIRFLFFFIILYGIFNNCGISKNDPPNKSPQESQ